VARLALFDLDRTLIDVNSGSIWLRHEWRTGRLRVTDLMKAAGWLFRYQLGSRDLDGLMDRATALYRGLDADAFRMEVLELFESEVAHRLRPGARAALRSHRDAGDILVLATTNSQFIARPAADAFGMDHAIFTELEVLQGELTGKLRRNALGPGKLQLVQELAAQLGHGLEDAAFYSDSASDLPLLEAVGFPSVVSPDRKLRQVAMSRGWPVLDWDQSARPA